jgi:hypothetical protein
VGRIRRHTILPLLYHDKQQIIGLLNVCISSVSTERFIRKRCVEAKYILEVLNGFLSCRISTRAMKDIPFSVAYERRTAFPSETS